MTEIAKDRGAAHLGRDDGSDWSSYFLRYRVREWGKWELEEAIRRTTQQPAALLGLYDRGMLLPGYAADVIISAAVENGVPIVLDDQRVDDCGLSGRVLQPLEARVARTNREEVQMDFDLRPLEPIGAEIRGLELRDDIGDADFARLRRLVVEWGVVVLHDQHLTPAQHVALGRRFGVPERGAFNEDTPDPELILLTNCDRAGKLLPLDDVRLRLVAINEGWHTDSSFRSIPATFSLFFAVVVPPEGGDTFFASLRHAWEALSREDQASVRGLVGIHDYKKAFERFGSTLPGNPIFDLPIVKHPLVRLHPETGETALYTSEHVMAIEGMSDEQARPILDRLLRAATAPERVYRHHFRVGDLVIWDNRSMIHRAQGFDDKHAREMHHVRIAGTEAVAAA